jgi:hypothetical protein
MEAGATRKSNAEQGEVYQRDSLEPRAASDSAN